MPDQPTTSPIRVLLLDADLLSRQKVIQVLTKKPGVFTVSEVGDRLTLEAIFNDNSNSFDYDAIISEAFFPNTLNYDPISLVRSRDPLAPVIILTATRSIISAVQALKSGADDYVRKSSKNLNRLPDIIRSVIHSRRDNEENTDAQIREYAEEIVRKNQALAEARDRAIEASRLKSEYLAMMGHEIRTPMNAMSGMTELLLDTSLSIEQRDYVNILRDSSQVLLALINDVLDFSKIEAGKLALEKIEFNPLELVESSVEVFTSNARQKNLDLTMYISPQVPLVVRGDPMRLRQVMTNLISNAVKFTDSGEVEVRADLLEETEEFVMLLFQVRDTGIGLSEENQSHLFQPFTQADESTSRKYGGTGLGLAISRRLVELMDGEISVSSALGKGSTFWFTATFEKCSFPDVKPAWESEFGSVGLKAIVSDVSSTLRESIKRYLEIMEMQVDEASSPEEALQSITSASQVGDPYNIAIVGLNLPFSDDPKLPPTVTQIASVSPTIAVLMTPIDQRRLGEKAVEFGFSTYLIKPIRRINFLETIHNLIAGKPLRRLADESNKPITKQLEIDQVFMPGKERGNRHPILLVEDNSTNLHLATLQLQKLGYTVQAVSNGKEAIDAFTKRQGYFLAILMDVHMAGLDGYETTRQIRAIEKPKDRHTPIIAMTASAMESDRDACYDAGMDDFITKPVTLANLHKVLQNWGMQKYRSMVQNSTMTEWQQISPLLDSAILYDISSIQTPGEPDVLIELINIYLKDSTKSLQTIKDQISQENLEGLKRSLHSLKGSSGNIGAKYFAARCAEMEKAYNENNLEKVKSLLPQAEVEYNQVCQALIEYRDQRMQANSM